MYSHEEIHPFQYLYSYCGGIAPNRYETENDILELEVLPPTVCEGHNEVKRSTKTAKRAEGCIHYLYFDLGFEYMEQMLNVVPVETNLLKLDELQRVLDNRNQLEYWCSEWKFRLSRNPVHYEWMELPENSDVWERLHIDKKKSKTFGHCFDILEFYDI